MEREPKNGVRINCLAFADDLAISRNTETAAEQINVPQEQAEKAGLWISFKNTARTKHYNSTQSYKKQSMITLRKLQTPRWGCPDKN